MLKRHSLTDEGSYTSLKLIIFSEICPPGSYKNSACFANELKQVACLGDSGGPIFFIHQKQVYLYAIISSTGAHKCQADEVGTLRYPTVGARIKDEEITWISDQSGSLVKNCVKP